MDQPTPRLLVVDDEANIRRLLERNLSPHGYRIREAESAVQALALLDSNSFDMLLLDVTMPEMNGFELLTTLRKRFAPATLPILMLTALDKSTDVITALRLGANDYLTKPIDFDLLLRRMRVHLAIKLGRGQMLGGYRIVDRLGEGGMGTVLSAVDVQTGDAVAIKVLPRAFTADDDSIMRFLREARLAANLSHPNLVRVLGSGKADETYFMIMERAAGHDLATLIDSGPLALREALSIARQIALGLTAVHAGGIIHRDVKPENIIVDVRGVARLTDFGIARENTRDSRLTDPGRWFGSVPYASPEQLRGEDDYRSDLYGLGCTLFAMLTGRDPFNGQEPLVTLLKSKTKKPPRVRDFAPGVPQAVCNFVARLMAPRPGRRPQSGEAVVTEMDALTRQLDRQTS